MTLRASFEIKHFLPSSSFVPAIIWSERYKNIESDLRYESCNSIPSIKRSATDSTTKLFDIQGYIGRFRKIKQEILVTTLIAYEIRYKVDMHCINYYHVYRRMYIE